MNEKHIKNILFWAFCASCSLVLSSCYETKEEFTLNPDGSGKVTHECTFQDVNLSGNDDTSKEALQSAIAKVIESSTGVDVWSDVSFKRLDDGRMWFQGTAYFKDLAKLEIKNQSMLKFDWQKQGAGSARLAMVLKKNDNADPEPKTKELSPDEKTEKLKADRAKYQQSKPMFEAILGKMKQSVIFHLPGKIDASSNFTKSTADTLELKFEGTNMLSAIDTLMNDDNWVAKNGFDAQKGPELDEELNQLLFGDKSPVSATVSVGKSQFDYVAEVAAAMKALPKLEKQLGVVSIAPPAAGEPLLDLRVVGVQLSSEVDKKLDLRPFNNSPGYKLSILATLPGSVLNISDKSSVETAIATDGTNLLKSDRDWDRRLKFPKLSADKASVLFDVELALPPTGAKGLKEISGILEYQVAGGTKKVDLGLTPLKSGTVGIKLNATIKGIKDGHKNDGSQRVELKLNCEPETLKSASLTVDGVTTALDRNGYSSSGGSTTFTFLSETPIPKNGNIVVEMYDQLKNFQVPFKLENLTMFGIPVD